jgi:hypothetical protein
MGVNMRAPWRGSLIHLTTTYLVAEEWARGSLVAA